MVEKIFYSEQEEFFIKTIIDRLNKGQNYV